MQNCHDFESEIVISGMSGRFPNSDNVDEFWENLIGGKDMIADGHDRYHVDDKTMPTRLGVIKSIETFDAEFFSVHGKQAECLDPKIRKLVEVTYEAILDAGVNPVTLRGSNIGVFVAGTESEAGAIWRRTYIKANFYGALGNVLSMMAGRLAFTFGFNGPSYVVDTACSAAAVALQHAVLNIRNGLCDAAIVAGSQLHHDPASSYVFQQLEMTSMDGKSKVFDASADGYCRAEAVAAIYICKKQLARRSYSTIVHIATNNDGYKEQGITFPSEAHQERVIRRVYDETGVDPLQVEYLEAHGTGTKVGDPEEMSAVTKVFCEGRKGPLLIGSIKSNMGHTETVSGLCSVVKIMVAHQQGTLPANLHYKTPNPDIPGLHDGRLKVADVNQPFNPTYVGMNSMGFGGTNVHVLFKMNAREEELQTWSPPVPLLLVCSGRTQEAVEHFLQRALSHHGNHSFVSLLHEIYKHDIPRHPFRGYVVVEGEKMEVIVESQESKRSVWFAFPGLGSQWLGMCKDMVRFDSFRESIERACMSLANNGYCLSKVFQSEDVSIFDNLKNAVVPITAVQVALVDLLKTIGIEPDGIIGHSTGEVAAGYADGCLTQDQAILVALGRARAVLESNCPPGTVASVGLTWEEAHKRCPPGIYPVIHNSKQNVTVAGAPEAVTAFAKMLEEEGVFAKSVRSASFGFHSPLVEPSAKLMQEILAQIILEPKLRSKKWLSSSVPESKWGTDLAKYCSPEYYVNNGVQPVYFYPALKHIPESSLALEIAPHCFMQTILKQSLPANAVTLGLIHCKAQDNCVYFLNSIGKCFLAGVTADVAALYGTVQFPVTHHVPSISSMVKWDHSTAWEVPHHAKERSYQKGAKYSFHLLMDSDAYLEGHSVEGKTVFPATGYLWLVWKFFAAHNSVNMEHQPVVFENVQFERVTFMNKRNATEFLINIFAGSGKFEVVESDMVVCTGGVRELNGKLEDEMFKYDDCKALDMSGPVFHREDFYKELHLCGYGHSGLFQGIHQAAMDGTWAKIEWLGHWIPFMDSMLQAFMLRKRDREMHLPTRIEKLTIDPQIIEESFREEKIVTVNCWDAFKTGTLPGCEVRGLQFAQIPRRSQAIKPTTVESIYIPFIQQPGSLLSQARALESSSEIVLDNSSGEKFYLLEILKTAGNMIAPSFLSLCQLKFLAYDFRTINESDGEINEETLKDARSRLVTLNDAKVMEPNHLVFTDNEDRIMEAAEMIIPKGFILFQGSRNPGIADPNVLLISEKHYSAEASKDLVESFYLYRKLEPVNLHIVPISTDGSDFKWVELAKKAVKNTTGPDDDGLKRLIFYATSPLSGIVGFVKCLAREIPSERVRCYHLLDSPEPDFLSPSEDLRHQIRKDLLFNIWKFKSWGCLNNVVIPEDEFGKRVESSHVYANALSLGQLSSLTWVQSPLKLCPDDMVEVHYAALNFRDIMLASGKLVQDALSVKEDRNDCFLGLEFSGVFKGRRVCGVGNGQCLATFVVPNQKTMYDIPENWTYAEAASVPAVYSTVYYALVYKARLQEGESILIHAGSGGVGQAAICLALGMKCKVFTTVSSEEKRNFLKSRFPALTEDCFANSRDASDFERHIYKHTEGKGVDVVLNSLAQEKLQASLRCLGQHGRFLEIGKVDVFSNTNIGMSILARNVSIIGIFADDMDSLKEEQFEKIKREISDGMQAGIIQPISLNIFKHDQLEEAFRFMAQGKHIGKVLIQVKEDDASLASIPALPRTYFPSSKSFLIVGGLGGMGFELVKWMIDRGARNFVLSSRSGVVSTFHEYHLQKWFRKGVKVVVEKADDSTPAGAFQLMCAAGKMGRIGGIFNTALVLKDEVFTELTPDLFSEVMKCKATATMQLDSLSRQFEPELEYFVVFSSIVSARGNPGQTNYGMANSAMERVCEQRREAGFSGLAVQWGAVADVGVVHRTMKDRNFFGMSAQRIKSCLETLDLFLQQERAVVCSFVRSATTEFSHINPNDSLVNIAAQILGIKDLSKVNHKTPLVDLGMDSLMAAELSQAMSTKRNIQMSRKEYAQLNFERLAQLDKDQHLKDQQASVCGSWGSRQQQAPQGLDKLLKLQPVPEKAISRMKFLPSNADNLFMVHPIDGSVAMLETLARGLDYNVYGIECSKGAPVETIGSLAEFYVAALKEIQPEGPYKISGYSFGASVAFEIVRQLETRGEEVSLLLLLDSSPKYKTFIKGFQGDQLDKEDWENAVLLRFVGHYLSSIPPSVSTDLNGIEGLPQKCSYLSRLLEEVTDLGLNDVKDMIMAFKARADAEKAFEVGNKVKARTVLIKATKTEEKEVPSDYGLSSICEAAVEVFNVDGSHLCFYEKPIELGIPTIIMNNLLLG